MPSKFIVEQADILHRTKNPELVIKNLKEKYTASSFPSQMSRVKTEWYKYNDRHPGFQTRFNMVYDEMKHSNTSKDSLKELKRFGKDDLIIQVKKRRSADASGLTGDFAIDSSIAAFNLLPSYMDKYHMSSEDKADGARISSKSLEKRSMDCIEIDDADELVDFCKETIKKLEKDPFTIAACLGIVCGRRSIEILKTGAFDMSDKSSYAITFDGAAKKKSMCSNRCDIPLLMKAKYVIPGIEYIRNQIPCGGLDNAQVNSKYSHKLGTGMKRILNNLDVRFHDGRAAYGLISFQVYKHNYSINLWLQRVLLHESIDTSIYYSRCKVKKCELSLGKWIFD